MLKFSIIPIQSIANSNSIYWGQSIEKKFRNEWIISFNCSNFKIPFAPDQRTVQEPVTRSWDTALCTAPKAAERRRTFFMLVPSSSVTSLLHSFLSASLLASSWLVTCPTSCSSLISMTARRSDSRSVSVSSSSSRPGPSHTLSVSPVSRVTLTCLQS